jgi:hypothetical protein
MKGIAVAAMAAAIGGGTVALGETVRAGNLLVAFEGTINPLRLPREKLAPVALRFDGRISTVDGTHVPVVKTLSLELNKHGGLNAEGIPTCRSEQLANTLTSQALQTCGPALIGRGNAGAEIAFPDQQPFNASGPLLIFNSKDRAGRPQVLFHLYAHVPAPTTFVTVGKIRQVAGGLGRTIDVRIPTIVSGQGSLTSFDATFREIVRANCPAPKGLPGAVFRFAKASFEFADGTAARSTLVRQCKVRGE